jgi:hypothetical protein
VHQNGAGNSAVFYSAPSQPFIARPCGYFGSGCRNQFVCKACEQ